MHLINLLRPPLWGNQVHCCQFAISVVGGGSSAIDDHKIFYDAPLYMNHKFWDIIILCSHSLTIKLRVIPPYIVWYFHFQVKKGQGVDASVVDSERLANSHNFCTMKTEPRSCDCLLWAWTLGCLGRSTRVNVMDSAEHHGFYFNVPGCGIPRMEVYTCEDKLASLFRFLFSIKQFSIDTIGPGQLQ